MSEKIIDPLAKKYKRKLIINIILIASSIAIICFIIIAYIGTLVGNYTINMKNDGMSLTMADNREFRNSTSRLRANSLPYTLPITADDLPESQTLDDTDGSHNGIVDENSNQMYYGDGKYLAYTFYMRNQGVTPIAYEQTISITEMSIDDDGRGIDDILRLRFYENKVTYNDDGSITTTHDSKVYAKRMTYADTVAVVNDQGNVEYISENRECVGRRENADLNGHTITVCSSSINRAENALRAETFYSDTEIIHLGVEDEKVIQPNETIRFTIVAWLEGEDPDCVGETPDNPSITLSSRIVALREIVPVEE